MSIANEIFTNKSNANKNAASATGDLAAFVASHEATINYLIDFGTPIEKAKAKVLLKIASGVGL
jgi:hypothetical protein